MRLVRHVWGILRLFFKEEANICDLEFKLALNYDTEIKFYVKRALKVAKFVLFFQNLCLARNIL